MLELMKFCDVSYSSIYFEYFKLNDTPCAIMSKAGTGQYSSVVLRVARFHRYVCGKPPLSSSADKRASPDMSFLAQALTVDLEGTKTPLTSHGVPRPNIRMHYKLRK